jgi:hypothetical protein
MGACNCINNTAHKDEIVVGRGRTKEIGMFKC